MHDFVNAPVTSEWYMLNECTAGYAGYEFYKPVKRKRDRQTDTD